MIVTSKYGLYPYPIVAPSVDPSQSSDVSITSGSPTYVLVALGGLAVLAAWYAVSHKRI